MGTSSEQGRPAAVSPSPAVRFCPIATSMASRVAIFTPAWTFPGSWTISWPAGGRVTALNGSGAAAQGSEVMYDGGIPAEGARAATVPGAAAAWAELIERFGSRSLAELLRPAIAFAGEGFAVSPQVAANTATY